MRRTAGLIVAAVTALAGVLAAPGTAWALEQRAEMAAETFGLALAIAVVGAVFVLVPVFKRLPRDLHDEEHG